MNAAPNTKPFRPRKKSAAIEQKQADFASMPLSGANTEPDPGVSAPSHSQRAPSPKSGEALPAAGQSVSAAESSPAPGPDAGSNSAPSAATPSLLAEPSLQVPGEGSVAATVGADSSKALTVPERAKVLLKSEQTERDLRALLEDSQRITVITNADGRSQAHAILMRHVRARTALDDADKVAREDMIALTKGVIDEKKRLAAINAEDEKRIRELRDAWDKKIEDEKRARAEAEQRRKDAIEARIEEIRNRAADAIGKTSVEIAALIEETTAVAIDDTFAEFKSRAESVQKMTLDKLRYFHQSVVATEEKARELAEQEARLAEERAELARQKAAEELRQAQERERLAEEQRQAKKAVDAEAARQAEQLRRQREEQEAEAARVKAVQDARDAEAAEQQRRQDEESERARERNEMAMQEISAIHHQLMIADVGRAPYCKGGDLHSFDWVIEQTEKWEITTEKFGVLAGSAQKVKDSTLASLRKGRADLVKRLQEEEKAQVERDRLAAARADLERQHEALRLERETTVAPTDPVEATDGELLSSETLFGDMASSELPPEPDAPSVDDAILTTLDALTLNYNLDDVRGKELIVRMGLRVTELGE